MRGTNIVLGTRPGATVLATHPTLSGTDGPMPVISVMDAGEGRSMAMTIDNSWRWNFDHVSDGGNSRPYTSFFNSAIRWLIRDPELNLIQVEIPEEMYQPAANRRGDDPRLRSRLQPGVRGRQAPFDCNAATWIDWPRTTAKWCTKTSSRRTTAVVTSSTTRSKTRAPTR